MVSVDACGRCAEWCPENAITITKKAAVTVAKCIGCGECYAVCPSDAIQFEWRHNGLEFQKRLADYCSAVRSKLGDRIVGRATITRRTRSIVFIGGELSVAGKPILTATGIWKILGSE